MAPRISVLGTTEIDGSADAASLTRRDRVVLGALATSHGEALSVDQLSDALWGDEPPKSAAKVVQGSVMRLRRLLGTDAIETTGAGYRLALDGDTVDAHAFERLVARARELAASREPERAAAAYEQALDLWRGAPLPELADWDQGRAEAERLLEVRRSVEEELVEARMDSGLVAAAVADAQHLVRREPYREHRWALLSLALYRSGRQREALDVLRRARTTLVDELGLDPGPELVGLEQRILQQDPALLEVPEATPPASSTCPWPGLRPFDSDQSELYAGRDADIESCVERLSAYPLLLVVGASGSGKSSLVRAGVVPRMRADGVPVVLTVPGATPVASLMTVVAGLGDGDVLVVDQLEELFASPAEEAVAYLDRLAAEVEAGRPTVVTLRADHLGALARSAAFARAAERGLLLLAPMDEDQLRAAIEVPARLSGLRLESGLADVLIRDVGVDAGGLPLLSHALAETWARRDGAVLTVAGYRATGGINGAVAQSAERLYESLSAQDRDALRSVLQRLVTPTPAGDPVAARVPTRVFDGTDDAPRLLDLLVRARLVTTSADTATLAHESLVRAWPRLSTWLDEDVEGQRVFAHLQVAADGWESGGRPDDELYRGARLETALEWRERTHPVLAEGEVAFLDASAAYAESEERRRAAELAGQRTRNRQLRGALAGVVGLLALSLVAGSLAVVRGRQAQDSASAASSSATSALAGRLSSQSLDPSVPLDTALLLARQAAELSDQPDAQANLLSLLVRSRALRSGDAGLRLVGSEADQRVTPDGSRILVKAQAALGESDTVYLIDTADGSVVGGGPLIPRSPGSQDFNSLPWAAGFVDGGAVAVVMAQAPDTAWTSRELLRFDARTGLRIGSAEPIPNTRSGDYVRQDRISITPDGLLLTSVSDHALRTWTRSASGWAGPRETPLPALPPSDGVTQYPVATRFDGRSSRAAVTIRYQGPGSWSYATVVLDLATGRAVMPVIDQTTAMDLSRDGTMLAVGTLSGGVDVHRVSASGAVVARVPGSSRVTAVGFSTDGSRLAVAHEDGSIAVFGLAPLSLISETGSGHDPTRFLGLLDSSEVLAVGDTARTTTYSLDGSDAVLDVVPTPAAIDQLAADAAGRFVAIGMYDGRVSLYDQSTLKHLRDLTLGPWPIRDSTYWPALHRRVTALALTPDGSAVVAADRTGHLRMWSTDDGSLLWSRDHVPTSWLAVSPDGTRLATEEFTQDTPDRDPAAVHPDFLPVTTSVRVWDLHTHQQLWRDELVESEGDHTPKPRSLAWAPDSSRLAAAFFSPVDLLVVYDAHDGRRTYQRRHTESDPFTVQSVAFTPDGDHVTVVTQDGDVVDVDPSTGVAAHVWNVPRGYGYGDLTYATDGLTAYAVSGYRETTLTIWRPSSGALVLEGLSLPDTDGDTSLVPTRDGRLLIGTAAGIYRLDTDPETWKAAACRLADRTLQKDEWDQYLGAAPYAPACAAG